MAWGVLTVLLLVLIPSARFGVPVWQLPRDQMLPYLVLLGAFLACGSIAVLRFLSARRLPEAMIALMALSVFGVVFTWMTLASMTISHSIYGGVLLTGLVVLPATFGVAGPRRWVIPLLVLASLGTLGRALYVAYGPEPVAPARTTSTILNTAFYNLEMRAYDGRIPKPAVPGGGGLARVGSEYLLVTGDGRMYLFHWQAPDDQLVIKPLSYRIPINGEEFSRAVGLPYERPRELVVGDSVGGKIDTWRFRVSDILLQESGERVRLFAGHHYWHNAQRCFVTRVSMAETDRASFLAGTAQLQWKTLYDAKPCLPVEGPDAERASPFEGNLSGGRLALLDADTLLFTVGFHGFDGVGAHQLYSQDPNASWGTTVAIHLGTGQSETFATGQRNQQGLFVDGQGDIWETEHGARGGDELNLLKRGGNYGWPYVTYGTDYTSLEWPLSKTQGRHDGYIEPVFAWVPSIGVSNLIRVEGDLMPVWKGELLVSSLRAESLFRMHLVDHHVVMAEPIPIHRRVRTLLEGFDGRIVLWTEDAALVTIGPASGTSGELLFASSCGGCHKVEGATNIIGPDLMHVLGRKVASADGYQEYSAALKHFGGRWDRERLDRFLTNPQALVPGTAMPFAGIADAKQRAAILDFLTAVDK
jgi:cytochrome c2